MLNETFIHCRGIGEKTAARLKESGYLTWADVLEHAESLPLGVRLKNDIVSDINRSEKALQKNNIEFFTKQIPTKEQWRILFHYWQEATFLDIETSGFSYYESSITAISVYHKDELYIFNKGINLRSVLSLLRESKLLITFSGSCFDLPRIIEAFRLRKFPCPHVDLRWQCQQIGWTGGLKQIEKKLGILRPPELSGLNGLDAIELWDLYIEKKDSKYLDELNLYASCDTLSLKIILLILLQNYGLDGVDEKIQTLFAIMKDREQILRLRKEN